jgi:hypothetical protein
LIDGRDGGSLQICMANPTCTFMYHIGFQRISSPSGPHHQAGHFVPLI